MYVQWFGKAIYIFVDFKMKKFHYRTIWYLQCRASKIDSLTKCKKKSRENYWRKIYQHQCCIYRHVQNCISIQNDKKKRQSVEPCWRKLGNNHEINSCRDEADKEQWRRVYTKIDQNDIIQKRFTLGKKQR